MRVKTLFLVAVLIGAEALLLRLGVWQMHRMEQKNAEKAAFMATLDDRTKTFTGRFDHSREVVLESQKRRNDYGYRILTPLVTSEQEIIVDRGWVRRSFEPHYLARFHVPGEVTVKGILLDPPVLKQAFMKGPVKGAGAEGVGVLKVLKPDEIPPGKKPRLDRYLQATTNTHPQVDAFFVPPPGGAKHREYMLTWFSLALILPLLVAGLFWRRKPPRS